jgi:transcriptional regulator GlxA family with amidase domain
MTAVHDIILLTYSGSQILDSAGPLQMFAGANEEAGRALYAIRLAAEDGAAPIVASSGLRLLPDIGFDVISDDVLAATGTLIAGGGSPGLETALADGRIAGILRRAEGRCSRIAAVCTGAFFLADAGLLDGRRATTHWQSAARLQAFRPAVRVEADAIHIRDGHVWTSAGVTAGMDLALAMIEADHGRDLALAVARRHVIFRMRPGGQSQFSADLMGQAASTGGLDGLIDRVTAAPHSNWTVEELADAANLTVRTLSRRFRKTTGTSPAGFVERVRLDAARRAILETDEPLTVIAEDAGFGSLRRMDRSFARLLGTSPSEFRQRFRS